jgi:predicted 3-demethylubiquinone-9 3-methyltransferase (glyoxalase superfamily)
MPHLWFDQSARDAAEFYVSVFANSRITSETALHDIPYGDCDLVAFELEGQSFLAISGAGPAFKFNEAISFLVHCDTQDEIDHYWQKLSAVREAEQCGWLKDKYGLSWQIVPKVMIEMLTSKDEAKKSRLIKAFLQMKKLDIETLQNAYHGNG